MLILPSLLAQQPGTNAPPKPAPPQAEAFPLMRAALHDLEQARTNLVRARHAFGGHRITALKACEEAIKEVNEGLKYAEEKH